MQIGHLSPSKLDKILLCEARAAAQIEDDDYEEERGEEARIGGLAHAAAKNWYRPVRHTFNQAGHIETVEYGFNSPDDAFTAGMHELAHPVDPKGNPRPSEMPHSPESIQEARTKFDQIIAFYDRSKIKVVFAERRYIGTLANGVPVHLIIDLGLDDGNGVLTLVDFKTGFIACTTEEMWDKNQVLMNLVAVGLDSELARYTLKQFKYFWVPRGFETGPISLTPQRLSDYEHFLFVEYGRIGAIQEPSESINRFCKSCGRQHKCKKFAQFLAESFGQIEALTENQIRALTPGQLMAQHDKLKGQIGKLETSRDFIGNLLRGLMEAQRSNELTDGGFKVTLRANKRESYDTEAVLKAALAHGINPKNLFSVSKKEVEQTFGGMPEIMAHLNQSMIRGSTAPFIMVNAVKEKKPRGKAAQAS